MPQSGLRLSQDLLNSRHLSRGGEFALFCLLEACRGLQMRGKSLIQLALRHDFVLKKPLSALLLNSGQLPAGFGRDHALACSGDAGLRRRDTLPGLTRNRGQVGVIETYKHVAFRYAVAVAHLDLYDTRRNA